MDDLKIFADSKAEIEEALNEEEDVSNALGMEFGLAKCAVAHARAGRLVGGSSMELHSENTIPSVQYGDTYKYLGISQLFGANLRITKARIYEENIW